MIYRFTSIIGDFYFNEHGKPSHKKGEGTPDERITDIALNFLNDKKYYEDFWKKNIEKTMHDIKQSFRQDETISQLISAIEEHTRAINTKSKRLREWFSYHYPEIEKKVDDEKLIGMLKTGELKQSRMGNPPEKNILRLMISLAKDLLENIRLKDSLEKELDNMVSRIAPNMQDIIGTHITAKLIRHAGTLEKLTKLPSSTLQLLGAEKALFRHLANKKSRCPKYGLIFQSELISGQKKRMQGRAARLIASKLSIASKIDYFKGKSQGKSLRKQIVQKLKKESQYINKRSDAKHIR